MLINYFFFFVEKSKAKSSLSLSKSKGSDHIVAQTFTFSELATATRNFRKECLIGEGGFGRVYKGYLASTGQVCSFFFFACFSVFNLLNVFVSESSLTLFFLCRQRLSSNLIIMVYKETGSSSSRFSC